MKFSFKIALGSACLFLVAILFLVYEQQKTKKGERWDLKPGLVLSYALEYKAKGESLNSAVTTTSLSPVWESLQRSSTQTNIKARLTLKVEKPQVLRFHFAIDQLEAFPVVWLTPLQGGPFYGSLILDDRGAILSYQLDQQKSPGASWLIRDLFALMELEFPSLSQERWQRAEIHPGHQLAADWQITVKGDEEWSLVKNYSAAQNLGVEVTGTSKLRIDGKSKAWRQLEAKRHRILGAGQQARSIDETFLSLKSISPEEIPAMPSKEKLASFRDDLRATHSQKIMQEMQYQQELGSDTVESLSQKLEQAGDLSADQLVSLYLKIKASIALYPERLSVWQKMLESLSADDGRFGAIAAALRSVGSVEAQALLQSLISAWDQEPKKQRQLIPHLAFVKEPQASSEALLKRLSADGISQEIRHTADLGLGIMASQVLLSDEKRAESLEAEYAQRLKAAKDQASQEHYLRVLGNMGLAQSVPTIQLFLGEAIALEVRATALLALRSIQKAEARSLLLQHLQTSAHEVLREAAAEALLHTQGNEADIRVFEKVLFQDKNLTVLKSVLQATAKLAPLENSALELLLRFEKACGKTELCSLASSLKQSISPR